MAQEVVSCVRRKPLISRAFLSDVVNDWQRLKTVFQILVNRTQKNLNVS